MAQKRTVGIDFLWTDASNTGRVNYIVSLVSALKLAAPERRPKLVIFHEMGSPIERIRALNYPSVRFVRVWEDAIYRTNGVVRFANSMSRKILKRDVFARTRPIPSSLVDCVIPCEHPAAFANVARRINWIVDFNERHLPHLFSDQDLLGHRAHADRMVETGHEIMLSSESARSDFEKFYPNTGKPVHVVRFAVGFAPTTSISHSEINRKFDLPPKYAITPNQFWPHKNHHLLVRAFAASRFPGQLLLTGAAKSQRSADYLPSLERLIKELGLEDRVRYLGQLPRDEQIALVKHATVVIQPSLFEGWSTLVEECKALGKYLIVSDIPVHREQISTNCSFLIRIANSP